MSIVKCRIIFFGTPEFSVPSLEALAKALFCDIKAVVTGADKPVGRHHSKPVPSSVKRASVGLKLPVFEGLEGLKGVRADLGIVVAYGDILPQWLLDHFSLGVVNIHPSLLPKYRGPSPIQAAIINRDKETGVTLIKLDSKMDHGPIVAQEVVSLRGSTATEAIPESATGLLRFARNDSLTAGELHDHLSQISSQMLIKYLPDYISGKIKPVPQDDSSATYTKKLTKEDGKIDWKKSPEEIEAHVRAMNPYPGAWTMWQGKRLIVWKASLTRHLERNEARFAGRMKSKDITSLYPSTPLRSAQDDGLILEEVQLEGKMKMPLAEFAKGHPKFDANELVSRASAAAS